MCCATLLSGAGVVCGHEQGRAVRFSTKKCYWMRDPCPPYLLIFIVRTLSPMPQFEAALY